MTVGIIAYGAYIPIHRIKRATIGKAWDTRGAAGTKAVANYDEDSLTMAVEAARDCLTHTDKQTIDGLYFASTTPPYREKQSAAFIGAVLGLEITATTMDFGGSLRCGTNALQAAIDAVEAGRLTQVLVCAADMRIGHPMGAIEMSTGDGAAAILIGQSNLLAEIEGSYSHYDEIQDTWRSDRDKYIRTAEERFSSEQGYNRVVETTLTEALSVFGKKPENFKTVSFNATDVRKASRIGKKLGFNPDNQTSSVLFDQVGNTGSAMSLMGLVEALEVAGPNEQLLVTNYANGCDVFNLKTTATIQRPSPARGIKGWLTAGIELKNYNKYLTWRELVDTQPPARPPKEERQPTPPAQWREVKGELPLNGTRCHQCGTPQYPPQRVCMQCKAKDDFEPYSFPDKNACVFSYSHDYVMETLDPPVTITVVDFEGGGRIMCDMTDRKQDEVTVGMEVEMTLRRLYYVGGIYNYWWKCRPVRR